MVTLASVVVTVSRLCTQIACAKELINQLSQRNIVHPRVSNCILNEVLKLQSG